MRPPLEYDLELAKAIKLFRELKIVKQSTLANALSKNQSSYCKFEQGRVPITIGQLHIISTELNMSIYQILALVDHLNEAKFNPTNISTILINHFNDFEGINNDDLQARAKNIKFANNFGLSYSAQE